jgi:enediyne polyketide synthase
VLRSASTGYQVDHFRGRCRIGTPGTASPAATQVSVPRADSGSVGLDPARDVYGRLLFHGDRFRRVRRYRRLSATECLVDLEPPMSLPWFGRYLPEALALGDPAIRDAAIHAIQACIPHALLLPVGVDRVLPVAWGPPDVPVQVWARERSRRDGTYVYDVDIMARDGRRERWEGLRLRQIAPMATDRAWPAPLLVPYLERRLQELIAEADVAVALEGDHSLDRRVGSDRAISCAVGQPAIVARPANGKPMAVGITDLDVSASHAAGLVLAVAGRGVVTCDAEPVVDRSAQVWMDVLGAQRFSLATLLARDMDEPLSTAATRVWTAGECLRKAGALSDVAVTLTATHRDGWALVSGGSHRIATYLANVEGLPEPLMVAILVDCASPGCCGATR